MVVESYTTRSTGLTLGSTKVKGYQGTSNLFCCVHVCCYYRFGNDSEDDCYFDPSGHIKSSPTKTNMLRGSENQDRCSIRLKLED